MTTIKSYTDTEQSKKLVKILPIESADMYYWCGEELRIGGYKAMNIDYDIPCWSLAALLNVLPSATLDSSNDHHFRIHCMKRYTEWYDNAVDACVEMIIRLNESKLL